jgi:Mg-chelatase subunit ChlD
VTQTGFTAEVYQNEYLPAGGRVVDAVITVSNGGAVTMPVDAGGAAGGAAARPVTAAQVIIVDTSGSMAYPPTKLANAQKATAAAIDTLREGVPFAVVAGDSMARMVYPVHVGMEPATVASRAAAKAAVRRLQASGGTAISTWLSLAERLFETHGAGPDANRVNHAILLTDGQNGEPGGRLRKVLASCEG